MAESVFDDMSPEVIVENASEKEDDSFSNDEIDESEQSETDEDAVDQSGESGAASQRSLTTTANAEGDDKHIYNSQIFNYNMIVDLVDEVYDEVYASDCQLMLIESKLEELKVRHSRALKRGRASIAYSLRVQMATVEGVKCMYDEYHARKRAKLDRLQAYSL